jgi:hypothetical protein
LLRCVLQCKQARLLERCLWTALLQWLAMYAHPCGCVAVVDRLAMYATVEFVCCVRGLASGATCTYAVRTRGSECCCWVRHARVVQCSVQCGCCLLLGVCETFQRVSQRGYTSPFVLQGPNLGNLVACVLLMNNATMPSFIHSYITCQTSVTNIPARAAAGRRGQNVRYIPAVWQRPTSGHVRPPSKHVPSFHLVLSFRETRTRESLSLSQAIGSRNNMLLRSDGCFPSGRAGAARPGEWWF